MGNFQKYILRGAPGLFVFIKYRGDSDAARPCHLLKSRAVVDLRNFLEFDLPQMEGISTFVFVVCFRVLEFDTQRVFAPVIRTLLTWLSFMPRSLFR